MKKVISLNEYKVKKDNIVLIALKEKIQTESNKEKKLFFKYWRNFFLFSVVFQPLITLIISGVAQKNLMISLMIKFVVGNLVIWVISELFQKCSGSIIFTNHFKKQRELLLFEKESEVCSATLMFKCILTTHYNENLGIDKPTRFSKDPDTLLNIIKSDTYRKFKRELQKTNTTDYSILIKVEKDLIKLNNEINVLSSVSKKDLRKIS